MMPRAAFLVLLLTALLGGCSAEQFSDAEKRLIGQLRLSQIGPLPPDPSNAVADDPAAAAFGEALFFDTRLSGDGTVSCATCHLQDRQFQDDLALAQGVGVTDRRTMPLANVSHGQWFFWDGRKDSLWAQALGPLEDAREHAGNRTAFAHLVVGQYQQDYEDLFGPLPDLSGLPHDASPLGTATQQVAWATMEDEQRSQSDAVFANIG